MAEQETNFLFNFTKTLNKMAKNVYMTHCEKKKKVKKEGILVFKSIRNKQLKCRRDLIQVTQGMGVYIIEDV